MSVPDNGIISMYYIMNSHMIHNVNKMLFHILNFFFSFHSEKYAQVGQCFYSSPIYLSYAFMGSLNGVIHLFYSLAVRNTKIFINDKSCNDNSFYFQIMLHLFLYFFSPKFSIFVFHNTNNSVFGNKRTNFNSLPNIIIHPFYEYFHVLFPQSILFPVKG